MTDAVRDPRPDSSPDCAGCGADDAFGAERRAFLKHAAAAAGAALVSLGAAPGRALAAPLAFVAPVARQGETRTYPVPAADGATIDREAEVILVRWQGSAYAFNLACPHQNTALRWFAADGRFVCPKHKSKYRPDGSFIEGRATRGMDRFSVKREPAGIVVDLDALHKQDTDPGGWAAAVVKL
ncbi:Rieske (2Fe-2S) protein [Roseisolibacter sp. H3M3-2]|uniref:QcrA and Rieske domain-containing protein n=1 Tax=Roseisolibacter sp. H3M3-2 TaxID=3031323 RepID=UPI0023DCAEC9|nr:Rieske (2Fe-2S) protein [Roseisolibacter sp. H3M3-2]MDF1505152.1 Rieske (2Fe-2S) protein [Roseisolibacter sp. H3M3-2]